MPLAVGDALKQLDRRVYAAERAIVVFALLAMAVIVFVDVVHRSFAGEENKFVELVVKLGGEGIRGAAPFVLAAVCVALAYAGVRTGTGGRMPPARTAGLAALGVAA